MNRLLAHLLPPLLAPVLWAGLSTEDLDRSAALARMGDLNCTACHRSAETQSAWVLPESAPTLNDLGARVNPEWVKRFLQKPRLLHPPTTMPDMLHGRPEAERKEVSEALTQFLYSNSPSEWNPTAPDRAAVKRGEILYRSIGCAACHGMPDGTSGVNGIALPSIVDKWTLPGLQRFLINPLAVRPSGRMPAMGLRPDEARDIAHFLLQGTRFFSPMEVSVYSNRIRSWGDLDDAEPDRCLPAATFSLPPPGIEGRLALRWSGWMPIDQEGEYSFFLDAVGAARCQIDSNGMEDPDCWENEITQVHGKIHLKPGWHSIQVDFVQRGQKPPDMQLEWKSNGMERQPMPVNRLRANRDIEPDPPASPFVVEESKVRRGQELFSSLQCSKCHRRESDSQPIPSISSLNLERGCLATNVPSGLPEFGFSASERSRLQRAIQELQSPKLPLPGAAQQLTWAFASFRCGVCHARDGAGGVSSDRQSYFTSNGQDLGEEGRIPPSLDGAGDKLKPEWLRQVLTGTARVRPYLNTRMPQFGDANVGFLVPLLVQLDRHSRKPDIVNDPPELQRKVGHLLVGTDGFSCIACHTFNRQPAHALQVMDLTTVTRRLNPDWFYRFIRDPNRWNVGTRMPAFWPEGVSPLKDILDGDTTRHLAAIWTYLEDAEQAVFPKGLSRQGVELTVGGEAVVYRGKLWEAGFRAVATGFPGGVNMAFDAEECRLSLLWRGRFLNVGPHWKVQGMGQIHPLGTDVVVFPHGTAWATLEAPDSPWPALLPRDLGLRFAGYQLDPRHQPTFTYRWKDLLIEDAINTEDVRSKSQMKRNVRISGSVPAGLYFRVAQGNLESTGTAEWRLNRTLTIRLVGEIHPMTRGRSVQQELLVPVAHAGEWEVHYAW